MTKCSNQYSYKYPSIIGQIFFLIHILLLNKHMDRNRGSPPSCIKRQTLTQKSKLVKQNKPNMVFIGCFNVAMLALFVVSSVTLTFANGAEVSTSLDIGNLSRSSFPHGFIFGAGSSSYQVCIYFC